MDLLPVTADYDQISERMRQVAASTYMELIEGLRPYVSEALSDPAGIHDTEPGRLLAYTGLVKLQATLIKELGLLYRVQDRPREDVEQEESMPVSEVQLLLDEAQRREDKAVAAAAELAEAATRAELGQREVVDLVVARDRVARGLKALGR
jgi:hypothetical protein